MTTISDIAARLGISKSTVSKALNNATDISASMRKRVLETAAEMGYINRRISGIEKKLCVLIENMDYETPNQFGHDIVQGFRQMAEADGWIVEVVPLTMDFQRMTPYGVFMLDHGYQAAFVLGFSLLDSWMEEFRNTQILLSCMITILRTIPIPPPWAVTIRRALSWLSSILWNWDTGRLG